MGYVSFREGTPLDFLPWRQDVLRAFADDQIFAYAIPDRQWIAAPDR